MNKRLILAAILTSTAAFNATAESDVTGPILTLGNNWYEFDSARSLDDESDPFIGFAYQITNHWSVGLEYSEIDLDSKVLGGPAIDNEFYSLNGLYRFEPRSRSSFFWKLGVSNYSDAPANFDDTVARFGMGYDFNLNHNFSISTGIDMLTAFDEGDKDLVPYVALNYFFGGSKPAPKPVVKKVVAPLDTDKDGVIDSADQCPSTAAGVSVDSKGCELDSDNDGVVDSKDACPNTPAGAKVDETGCRIMLEKDVSIKLNVQFANNSNEVTSAYRSEIAKVADFMRKYPDTLVTIEGHTDSRGKAAYNQQLSQRRAEAVMAYLISEFQVAAERVSADGKGEEFPIASNDDAEGRKMNRRVQAEITAKETTPAE